jgi:hypothetical protein
MLRSQIMANVASIVKEDGKLHKGTLTSELKNKAENAGAAGMDKAKEIASSAVDTAKEAAASVVHTMGEAASAVGDKANEATSAVGSGMESLAGTIRQHTPHEGMLGKASTSVADNLETGGRYLQEEGLSGMADEVTNLIRRNPIPAVLIGIGLGFLLAKVTTRS